MSVSVSVTPARDPAWRRALARWRRAIARWRHSALLLVAARLVPLVAALGLWVSALPQIDVARMTDMGLTSVLPLQVPLAVVLIVASGAWHLRQRKLSHPFLALHLAALILILYGTTTLVEQQPRFAATYIHVGISEYISRTGMVAPQLEARFDWPGFFILTSMLSQVIGLKSTMDFAGWAPVYLNLLYLAPLSLIFRSITPDPRMVWAGLWLFELTNWVGQDYFSPQGLNYFLFLSIIGLILTYFRTPKPASSRVRDWLARRRGSSVLVGAYSLITPEQLPPAELPSKRLAGLVVVLVVVFSYVSFSHQLTPFFTVAALLGLVALNRIRLRMMPILLGVIAVVWVSYMTVPFLSGHVAQLVSEFGQLTGSVGANVTGRLAGSPDHRFVVMLDMLFSASLWAMAAIGFLVRWRDGRRDVSMALLIASPVPLVAAQAYGGELVLRLYLFTLPFMAILAAGVVYGRPAQLPSRLRTCAVIAVCAAITMGFFSTRYGNERMDAMTTSEVEGIQQLYEIAPPGSLLMAPNGDLPWRSQAFELYDYTTPSDEILLGTPADLAALMKKASNPRAYLVLTASEEAEAELFSGVSSAQWDEFVDQMRKSPDFRLAFENADTKIFELQAAGAGAYAPAATEPASLASDRTAPAAAGAPA